MRAEQFNNTAFLYVSDLNQKREAARRRAELLDEECECNSGRGGRGRCRCKAAAAWIEFDEVGDRLAAATRAWKETARL